MSRSNRRPGTFNLKYCHVSLNADGFNEIAKRIEAKQAAWHSALGVPRALRIPEKPIPAGRAEREAELAIVTQLQLEAFRAMEALPPGQERESQSFAMVAYRERGTLLRFAIRDDDSAATASRREADDG